MAYEIHRVQFDRSKLGFADLADLAQALVSLERLAKTGVIEFGPSKAARGPATRDRLSTGTYREAILEALSKAPSLSIAEIQTATEFKPGTISGNLTLLVTEGLVTKQFEPRGGKQTVVYLAV